MKRTNVVLNEELLDEAVRVLGRKTYSATINLALEEAIRMRKIQEIGKHFGRGLWIGDLAEMREDKLSPNQHVHGRKTPRKKQ